MNNDDRLSSGFNIDMCIEQMKNKMSDDIIMQQIYISLCAYKIEIEELKNENETLKELNVCVGCENNIDYKSRCEKAIPMLKELNIKLKDILKIGIDIKEISNIQKILGGDE